LPVLITFLNKGAQMSQPQIIKQRFYSVKQIAEYLGWKIQTVYNYCDRGIIPYYKVGESKNSKTMFDIQEIESWIKSNKGAANG
jgi:excisionase family DNA binding protein